MEVHILSFDALDSTQKWAKKHASTFDPHKLTCIFAKTQTDGVGRFQREWVSEKGNLTFSFFFTHPPDFSVLSYLGLLVSLCVVDFLEEAGVHVEIKWPNDLVYKNQKLGGILVETLSLSSSLLGVVIGVGLNIVSSPSSLPSHALAPTYLKKIAPYLDISEDLTFFILAIADRFNMAFLKLKEKGFAIFASSFNRHLAYLGQEVIAQFSTPTGQNLSFKGILEGISEEAKLTLRGEKGTYCILEIAHTHHLRLYEEKNDDEANHTVSSK